MKSGDAAKAKPYGTQLLKTTPQSDELAEVPLGELAKLRVRNDAYARPSGASSSVEKRKTKNHPVELSSKTPVSLFRDVSVDGAQRRQRDPRFVAACGGFNPNKFHSDFAFLYDDALPQEAQELKKRLKETAGGDERRQIQRQLAQVQTQIQTEHERRHRQSAARHIKAMEVQAVRDGKKPYFVKRREIKKQRLIAKYKALKSEGRLEKYVEKRTRRQRR